MSGGMLSPKDPGGRIVYYAPRGTDENGKPLPVQRYVMHDIDARDAVKNHPDEYSFDPPAKGAKIIDRTPPALEIKPELLPTGHGETISLVPRLGPGGSHVIQRPVLVKGER